MPSLTAFLLTPDTLRVAFRYDAGTVEQIKRIDGATWNKAGKYWTLPLNALDKLIKVFGDDLAVDAEAFLAANPKTPAMVRAENALWAERQGIAIKPQDAPILPTGEATGRPACPGKCPACNTVWVYRDGTGWEPGCRCSCVAGPGTVRYDPVPLENAGTPTKYDEMLVKNLPAWVRQAEKDKARKGKGKKWAK